MILVRRAWQEAANGPYQSQTRSRHSYISHTDSAVSPPGFVPAQFAPAAAVLFHLSAKSKMV